VLIRLLKKNRCCTDRSINHQERGITPINPQERGITRINLGGFITRQDTDLVCLNMMNTETT
jgi:hypothetical protein